MSELRDIASVSFEVRVRYLLQFRRATAASSTVGHIDATPTAIGTVGNISDPESDIAWRGPLMSPNGVEQERTMPSRVSQPTLRDQL